MDEITIYFAGAWSGSASDKEKTLGIRNKLCSYVYPEQFSSWMDITKGQKGKILIDSGAFSVWNKGETIDLGKYIDYCEESIERAESDNKSIRVVNLDVIPGSAGQSSSLIRENKELVEKAAAQGFENLLRFIERGIVPIHVFHQGEDFSWIDRMVEVTDYIGVSPANDLPKKQKELWMRRVFSYLESKGFNVKTHGFAVASPDLMLKFPWTSCDAATWRLLAAYGGIYYPRGGFSDPDYSVSPYRVHVSNMRTPLFFIENFKDLFEKDGYDLSEVQKSWELRAEINIKYFLGLEKYLNDRKHSLGKIKKGFFL